jgi:hypothetical protein
MGNGLNQRFRKGIALFIRGDRVELLELVDHQNEGRHLIGEDRVNGSSKAGWFRQ